MTTTDENINLVATFRAKAEAIDTVRDMIVAYGHVVRSEPGNIFFEIYTDVTDDAAFVIIERYENRQAFEAHLAGPEGAPFNAALGELIEGDGSELQFLNRHV